MINFLPYGRKTEVDATLLSAALFLNSTYSAGWIFFIPKLYHEFLCVKIFSKWQGARIYVPGASGYLRVLKRKGGVVSEKVLY